MKRFFTPPRLDVYCFRAEQGFAGSDPGMYDPWNDWDKGTGDIDMGYGGSDSEFA